MKKIIYMTLILSMTVFMAGCKKEETTPNTESQYFQSEEEIDFDNNAEAVIELKDTIEIDFSCDYTDDIEADVNYVVSNSSSLQEELENISKITQKYTLLSDAASTQMEINVSSHWFYVIWDT